ncbi:MAG: AMP-binding protein [Xanthomonadales bacterium]|nr:AMP-binding protein [Xanthomonadales bacterium]
MSTDLFDIAARRAELSPHHPAMTDLVSGDSVTYAELDQRAGQAAGLLQAKGVKAGDRVALLCRNRIEFFEILLACARLSAIMVPLNWRMPATELAGLMEDCAPALLLYGREDESAAAELSRAGLPTIELDAPDGYSAQREAAPVLRGRQRWPAEDTWYLLYTSGTTGLPKAVIQTFGMTLANYVNISQGMGLRGDDVTASFLPLFHAGGINLLALPFIIGGGHTLIMPSFEPDLLVSLLRDNRLTVLFGVPAIYQALSLHPEFDSLDLSRIRSWACGGAPLPDVLVTTFAQRGARVCNGMGMTETGPTVFLMDPDNVERKIGSVGKPQILSRVRLVSNGRDVAQGETGELWFAGPGITPGYWNRPDATSEAFAEPGWLRSGDLGATDEDGYYYIVGRLKEMFISGGENVYPAEVENVLASHPAILEAAVIGVADQRWGEVGRAYLLARPEAQIPGEEELVAFCRERLAAYKVPKGFVEVKDFPRTAAGKIQKHLLT